METEVGVVLGAAIFEADIVADLEGEAVAIVVARDYVAEGMAVAVLDEYAAGVVAIDLFVLGAVAV